MHIHKNMILYFITNIINNIILIGIFILINIFLELNDLLDKRIIFNLNLLK